MTPSLLILLPAVLFMCCLLFFEQRESTPGILPFKTVLSLLFVLTAILQPRPHPVYFYWLLAGLIFCLGGDVFLAMPTQKMFRMGLVSFLLGHVCYTIGFFQTAPATPMVLPGAVAAAALSLWIFFRLKPHLGDMKVPVMCYITVITLMLCGALSLILRSELIFTGRLLALAGAAAFYVSDLFVARDRFVKKGFINRLVGLPLYYAGQFLLAFSSGSL